METIETKIGKIALLDNGIIRIQGNPNITITLEDMFENDKAFEKLLRTGNAPFLTIFGENATINPEAQLYFANKKRSGVKRAEALLTSQVHHGLIALTHTTHLIPDYPIRHFTNEENAIKWLLTFV